jgi:alanine racemase
VKFSSVIKGNAYGHGVENIIPMAESSGINHFSVFSANEALDALKVKSPKSQLMIMGLLDDEELAWAIENGIEFFVFDQGRLEKAIDIAAGMKSQARIHIEAETGFHRTGFEYEKLPKLVKYLKSKQQHFILEGICTHYAGAESLSNYLRIKNQIGLYRKFLNYLYPAQNAPTPAAHGLLSGGTHLPCHHHGYGALRYCPIRILAQPGDPYVPLP